MCIPNFKPLIELNVESMAGIVLEFAREDDPLIRLASSCHSVVGVFIYALAILGLCVMFLFWSELKLLAMVIDDCGRH